MPQLSDCSAANSTPTHPTDQLHVPEAWCCTSWDSHRNSHLRKEVPGVYSVPAGRCTMPRIWYLESRYGRTMAWDEGFEALEGW